MKFQSHQNVHYKSRGRRVFTILFLLLIIAFFAAVGVVYRSYQAGLQPLSNDKTIITVEIPPGSTNAKIADILLLKKIIRSDWAFEWYLRTNEVGGGLQAGTYPLSADKSVSQIVETLSGGKVVVELATILPGKRLDQIKEALVKSGFTPQDVDAAVEPTQYQSHPALSGKPPEASLEGYLYPDSFHKTGETSAKDIIKLSLDEMNRYLTPELREGFAKQSLSPHQGVILASIIERELSNPEDRTQASQVFYKRLKQGARLESNATDDYAKIDPAYDTYKISSLPPGPISNMSQNSLQAAAFPAATDWLYFVSGDGEFAGKTFFSKTLPEHQEKTRQYCSNCVR